MGISAKAELPRAVLGVLAGAACLWFANLLMQPVPVSAAGAYAAGATVLLASALRPLRTGYVALGALAGALPAFWVHRAWHVSGRSPAPESSLLAHVLGEGLLGLAVALVCLGLAVLAWRRFS